MPYRRSTPWLPLLLIALALAASLSAPAASIHLDEPPRTAHVTTCQLEATSLHARVDARAVGQPVLSPGLHWVPLPEPPPRLPVRDRFAPGRARADLHTLSGWCLAHSTATSLS